MKLRNPYKKTDYTQLDILEKYLIDNGIEYTRVDEYRHNKDLGYISERHQIMVPDNSAEYYKWDAICHYGSYGSEEGLLEIAGQLVDEAIDGDSVKGWLTAEQVIERIKKYGNEHKRS